MYDRVTIKREAKLAMRGSRPHFMLVALVYCLLTTGLGWVVQFLTLGTGGWLGMFLVILVALFSMVMYLGFCRFALSAGLFGREKSGRKRMKILQEMPLPHQAWAIRKNRNCAGYVKKR